MPTIADRLAPRGGTVGGGVRLARGALLGATAATLGVTAHGVASGSFNGGGLVVLVAALLGLGFAGLVDRPVSARGFIGLLGGFQLLIHVAMAQHQHQTAPSTDADTAPSLMVATHLVAVVLTGQLLGHADRVLIVLAAVMAGLATLLPPRGHTDAPITRATGPVITSTAGSFFLTVVLRQVLGYRGPPVEYRKSPVHRP